MQPKLSIEYVPILSHAVVQSAAAFLAGLSILDIMLTMTNVIRYGFWSPAEFHLAPLVLIVICALKIKLHEVEKGIFDYRVTVFGIEVIKKQFSETLIEPRGKFLTLLGKDKGVLVKTFISWKPSESNSYTRQFPVL